MNLINKVRQSASGLLVRILPKGAEDLADKSVDALLILAVFSSALWIWKKVKR